MAITRIDRLGGKTYDIEETPNSDQRAGFVNSIKEALTERYLIAVDSRFYNAIRIRREAQATNLVPIQNETRHPEDGSVICHRVRISQEPASPLHWIYEASYRYDSGEEENPIERPPDIEWRANFHDEAIEQDLDGKILLNSAGDRPDRPVVRRKAYPLAIVTKNVEPFPEWWRDVAMQQGQCTNELLYSLDGLSIDPLHSNLLQVTLSPVKIENDIEYRVARFDIECALDEYKLRLLDEGMRQKKVDGGVWKKEHILGADKQPVTQPVPLDGAGSPLVPSLTATPPLTAVYLDFNGFHKYDFNNFPLLDGD